MNDRIISNLITSVFILLLFISTIDCLAQMPTFKHRDIPMGEKLIVSNRHDYTALVNKASIKAHDMTYDLPRSFVKNATVDYTKYIQKSIDTHEKVIFPNFPVLINDNGLLLKTNTVLIFQKNSKIILKPTSLPSYAAIKIYDIQNVNVFFPVIVGDREKHIGKKGEWGMGIWVNGSQNVNIYQAKIDKCWGDGIYISNSSKNISNNIYIYNPKLDYNRRNGLTVTGGQNISILDPVISNTYGTPPMSGIDIEPNDNNTVVNNIKIINYFSFNNVNSGLQIGMSRLPGHQKKDVNILIENLYCKDSKYGIIIGGFKENYEEKARIQGTILLNKIEIVNGILPIKVGRNYQHGPSVKFKNVTLSNTNKLGKQISSKEYNNLLQRISTRDNISME